jgi:hypothetical protein
MKTTYLTSLLAFAATLMLTITGRAADMLPQLKRDADGGLTLIIQNESPGKDKEANWLPASKGPFVMYMRLYWPKDEALEGKWTAPKLKKVE